jgi:hypothetical protein
MSLISHLRLYSHAQQHLAKTARSAEQALRDVIAVYSAHPSAPLSLFARTKNFDAKKFRALEETRVAIRLGAMRGSIHLMPRATAPKIFAATIGDDPKMLARRLQVARVNADEYAKFKRAVLKSVREPMSVRALRDATGEKETGLGTLLRAMSDERLVLRVGADGLRSNDLKYVPTKIWLGEELPNKNREKSLVWLIREYLRAFGPVRAQDVMWWIGITKTVATKILAQIETIDVGENYLLLQEDVRAFEKIKPFEQDVIAVLPKWDAYTMGYAPDGRERFVSRDMQTRIYDKVGDGYGAILLNGLAIAAWDLKSPKDILQVNIDWFEKPSAQLKQMVIKEIESVAKFLECAGATIEHLGDEKEGRALGRMR